MNATGSPVNAKWDDQYYKNHSGINPTHYVSRPASNKKPTEARGTFYHIKACSDGNFCGECKKSFVKNQWLWVGPHWLLCDGCALVAQSGTSARSSRGYTHRCIECSLVRCAGEGHRCEECADNMARLTG